MRTGSHTVWEDLKQEDRRRETVLVFRGTGLNIWHYYPFLKNFSLRELSQFRALYAVSGAALLLWLYCLIEQEIITDAVAAQYDAVMRRSLNRRGLLQRTGRLLAGRYPYAAEDFLEVFRRLAPPPACDQTLGQLPLTRMRVVAQDESRKQLLVLGPNECASYSMGEVISRAVTWEELFGRPFCYRTPYRGLLIGDFDFAGKGVRDQFRQHLRTQHPGASIYQINLFQTAEHDSSRFVRLGYDRFPRAWQIIDFGCFYFGIPNCRYRQTASRKYKL
jgi:hypothetical protein